MALLVCKRCASASVNSAGICCTMKMGAPIFAGHAGSNSASAAGPPVETPMSTMGAPFRPGMRAAVATGTTGASGPGAGSLVARVLRIDRISRCRANVWMIGRRLSRSCTRLSSCDLPSGLVMKSKAPASSARIVIWPPFTVRELSMTTEDFCPDARIASSISMPFISGISMSSVTRSGRSAAMRANASLPFEAVPTTSTSCIPARASEIIRRNKDVSSTTSTRVVIRLSQSLPASLLALVQNFARIQDRDDMPARAADLLKEAGLCRGNIDGQRFFLPGFHLHHVPRPVHQDSQVLVAVFQDEHPALAGQHAFAEPENDPGVQQCHDLAPQIHHSRHFRGRMPDLGYRLHPNDFLYSGGDQGAQSVAHKESRQ